MAWTPQEWLDSRRIKNLRIRQQTENGIREFFTRAGFIETRTPLLVRSPGMEPHIRPIAITTPAFPLSDRVFLPTSPEFAMKKLLSAGLKQIFQITSAFRAEPVSSTHLPEFTLLEWYRTFSNYEQIMEDTEQLIYFLIKKLHGHSHSKFQNTSIDFTPPWPRYTTRELFQQHTSIDIGAKNAMSAFADKCRELGLSVDQNDSWDDLYFKVWLNAIEPHLPKDRPIFVTDYPPSQAALANIRHDSDGTSWAKRFELYAGGLELANAFDELVDAAAQKNRFVDDMNLREKIYGPSFPKSPIDPEFIAALQSGIPPSGGIALGVDRLVQLLADEPDISYTVWLPPYWPDTENDNR